MAAPCVCVRVVAEAYLATMCLWDGGREGIYSTRGVVVFAVYLFSKIVASFLLCLCVGFVWFIYIMFGINSGD